MDIAKIREKYNNGDYTHKYTILVEVSADHVFDENLSIKANREMIEEHNRKVREQRAENRAKQIELERQMRSDVVGYIVEQYELNRKQAEHVEQWVYGEHHSFMGDYFFNIDELADFAETLIKLGGEAEND